VALATVYRYFNSKDYLLAAALEDWQERLPGASSASREAGAIRTRCQASWITYDVPSGRPPQPHMTALIFQTTTSTRSEARATIDQMNRHEYRNVQRSPGSIAAEDIPNITFGLNAALSSSLAGVLAGMMTLENR